MSERFLVGRHHSAAVRLTLCLAPCLLCLMSGCALWGTGKDYYELEVPPEQLRQIEPLKLEQAAEPDPKDPTAEQPAPAEMELTLEQSRALALENNLSLKAQLISPAIAAARVSEEQARFEAAFFTNLSFTKTDSPSVSFLDEITGSKFNNIRTDLGVQVPLRTGGTLQFDVVDNRTLTDAQFTQFNPYYASDVAVSISQPLLRNAGKWASTYSIRLARYDRDITDARTKLEVIRVIAALDRVYWRLYAARKELEVRQQQYKLAQAQLEQAERFVRAGERAPVEVIRAEAGVAQQLEAIIVAENNLRDRQRELKAVVNKAGLEMQSRTSLIPVTEPDPVRYQLDGETLVEQAVANRADMLELELQIARDAATVDYLRNQALPLVTLDYTYNLNGLGATRQQAFDLLYDNRFADHRMGLNLMVPLGNKAAKSRLLQAHYQRQQRLANRASQRSLVEQEVLDAGDQAEANWQRILASRQNAILAGRLYEAERRQFNLGLRTSTEVLDAQTSFANAQSAEIAALTEYQIALVDLAYATGTLLGAAKIEWEPIVPDATVPEHRLEASRAIDAYERQMDVMAKHLAVMNEDMQQAAVDFDQMDAKLTGLSTQMVSVAKALRADIAPDPAGVKTPEQAPGQASMSQTGSGPALSRR